MTKPKKDADKTTPAETDAAAAEKKKRKPKAAAGEASTAPTDPHSQGGDPGSRPGKPGQSAAPAVERRSKPRVKKAAPEGDAPAAPLETSAPSADAPAVKKPVVRKKKTEIAAAAAPASPDLKKTAPPPAASKPAVVPPAPRPAAPPSPVPAAAKPAQAPVAKAPAAPPRPEEKKPVPPSSTAKPQSVAPAASQAPARPPAPEIRKPPPPPAAPRQKIRINEVITVKELAEKMNVKIPDVIKKLMGMGTMANLNQRIDSDTATLVADAFGFDVELVPLYSEVALDTPDDASQLVPRPPVVTVMGHVDHGKTSLLDAIRQTRVAEKEAGGITQHIGAYQVKTEKGAITFLDTPGHEAFTAMRARGAQATDIVVLVVAADDGVMPQTVEALDHARAAGVPIVVAINKVDVATANPQRIKQELTAHQLVAEDWGGQTVMVEVSARQKKNLDKLLEMLSIEAELLELKANPNRPAQGVVVEAKLDPKRGPVATVLVQKGTLRVGDAFVCGLTTGKIRALVDHTGQRVKEAPPAFPVEILGLSETPQAGDKLNVVATEREAREIGDRRRSIASEDVKSKRGHMTLEALHDEVAAGKVKNLPIILKADVQGSVEAVRDSLEKLSTPEITLRVIHAGVGGINASDVILAAASDAVIMGFNVRPDPSSEELSRREGVEIKTYRIIYDMVNDVKAALEGLLDPEEKEVTTGWAEVRQVFRVPKAGTVAGSYVTEGKISRAAKVRLIRNGAIVHEGSLANLKRFKDDVRDVEKGYECGISLEGYQDVKPGDRLEFFVVEKQARRLGP